MRGTLRNLYADRLPAEADVSAVDTAHIALSGVGAVPSGTWARSPVVGERARR